MKSLQKCLSAKYEAGFHFNLIISGAGINMIGQFFFKKQLVHSYDNEKKY